MRDKAPAYQWYPKDYESDEAVKLMTYEQEGIYRRLLDHQALHGGIPADTREIAMLVPKVPLKRFLALWPRLATKFELVDGKLVNQKLERVKAGTAKFKADKAAAGHASAAARAEQHGNSQPNRPSNRPRTPVATAAEPASASASATPERTDARSKRPIFTGQRLTVFDWMLEKCIQTLGPLTDDFDLHSWFFDLDATAARTGMVIPPRDGGAWLLSQLVAEAQRRGLPIAVATPAPTVGKLTARMAAAVANARAEVQ